MKAENLVKNSRKRFWILLGLLLVLILVRYALQVEVPRLVLLAIIGVLALGGDRDEIVAVCLCCIPMHESIDFLYAVAICLVAYICKYHKHIRIGSTVLFAFLAIAWELLHCMRATLSIPNLLFGIMPFIVLVILMASDVEKLDYPFIVRAFAWTTLGISLMLLVRVLYFSNFNFLLAIADLQRLGSDAHTNVQDAAVSGGQINPNTLGIITVIAATGLMQLRSMGVGKKKDMILMCVLIVLAALGTSRTYLLCLALMVVLLILSEPGGMRKKLRLFGILCLAIGIVAVALAVIFPFTFQYFISRFTEADITTGRNQTFLRYHDFIMDNPSVLFFGIGLQDFGNRLVEVYRVAVVTPHNCVQEIIVAWGIPGLLLFAGLFAGMYHASSQRNSKQSLINWIPLLIILFKCLAGQLLTSAYTMLALSFAYLSLCLDLNPVETLQKESETDVCE